MSALRPIRPASGPRWRKANFPRRPSGGQLTVSGDTASVSGTLYKDMEAAGDGVASWNFGSGQNQVPGGTRGGAKSGARSGSELQDRWRWNQERLLHAAEAECPIAVSQKVTGAGEEYFRTPEARYKERVARQRKYWTPELLTRAKSEYANPLADYHISLARLERSMGAAR